MKETVVLGLSGGVDSAVAAARLMEQGYEVHGVYLDIGQAGGVSSARQAAAELGVSFESVDVRAELEEHVCAPFAADYLAGRTPLPCARCNPTVKFPALAAAADRIGARWIATGHYARTGRSAGGRALLLRGRPANDQSYMLARLPQTLLQRVLFPLGGLEKTDTRGRAAEQGLSVADKPDSMEICFIPDQDYAAWLDRRGGTPPPGDFVDREGRVLGRHKGIHHYTLGQRRGLGVPAASRLFVSAIRPETDQVVLSTGEDLYVDRAWCVEPNWIALAELTGPLEVGVRFRHSRTETPAVIRPLAGGVEIVTGAPARAPTPGQLAVFYQGDVVVGSGWIAAGPTNA